MAIRGTADDCRFSAANSRERTADSVQSRFEQGFAEMLDTVRGCIPDAKCEAARGLVANAAWMRVKLDDARRDLMGQALAIPYDNGGGQTGVRENPAFTAYNRLFGSYSKCVKQLTDLMEGEAGEADELMGFVSDARP